MNAPAPGERGSLAPTDAGGNAGTPRAAEPTPTHLLYLHGFRSSPRSTKARKVAAWVAANRPDLHWCCPQLLASPGEAMALVFNTVARWPAPGSAVIGSSLGGFYATVVAERLGWPAALLNPAVDPARDLASHLGVQTAYDNPNERFEMRAEFIHELRAMTPAQVTRPERYWALIAKGDEVLDWREMSTRYAGASVRLLEGSDHALSDFDLHLPELIRFLRLGS